MNRSLFNSLALGLLAAATSQAGLQMFDQGTLSKQVAVDGPFTYVLKESGQIWRFLSGNPEKLDDGQNTRMIAADQGRLYVLKDSGHIWELDQGNWSKIGNDADNKQITASGGRLYTLKQGGNIWKYQFQGWNQVDDGAGTKKIYAHGSALWILKDNNHTWKYDDGRQQFQQFSRGNVSLTQDIVGDEKYCYILKGDGKVWRGQWSNRHGKSKFDMLGQGSKHFKLAMDQSALNVLTRRGNVWRWDRRMGGWKKIPVQPGTKDIVAIDGRMFLLTGNGQVLSWSNGFPFAPQSSNFENLYGE